MKNSNKKSKKDFCFKSLKNDTLNSLKEVECFLNNFNYYCNLFRIFKIFKK